MMQKNQSLRFGIVFSLLVLAFFAVGALNACTGSIAIAPKEVFRILLTGGEEGSKAADVIWKIRLPRLLAAALLGGALSVSGFLLQSFFRNPIAGPYVLGISNGAKMLVGAVMVFVIRSAADAPYWTIMAASFLGSLIVTGFVLLFAGRVRSMAALLVTGIMIGSICTAVTNFLVTFADEAGIANLHSWSMGSFSAVSWNNLGLSSVVIFLCITGAVFLTKPMAAYQLGENYARSMGVNVKVFRILLIALSSLLSAVVTALAGPVSFVGVAIPHMARLLFGTSKPAVIIPGSFLLGSVFCMACDLIARTAFSPSELQISTVTAVFGAPVVIALMMNRQRRAAHD